MRMVHARRMKRLWMVMALGALPMGCEDDDCCGVTPGDAAIDVLAPPDAGMPLPQVALVPSSVNPRVDVLFVVDDSSGMLNKGPRFAAQMDWFFGELSLPNGLLPDLHIGVVTTDLGTQGTEDTAPGPAIAGGNCDGVGDAGILQTGDAPVTERFLRDVADPSGGRFTNYTGSRAEALTRMLSVGSSGCSFEQPLEAMRRALTSTENAGFLRTSARLAIIFLTDEDDCSMTRSALLYGDTATLGALSSFRCTRFGVTCDVGGIDPDQMTSPGIKRECHANDASSFLTSVAGYATFLQSLKSNPRDIFMHAIAGTMEPFTVALRTTGSTAVSDLMPSCSYEGVTNVESATPPARIADLLDRIPQSSMGSICSGYRDQVQSLGLALRDFVGFSRCLDVPIAQPVVCEAVDIDAAGTETVLPMCGGSSGQPCFTIEQDLEACRTAQGLKVEITRSTPVDGVWTSIRCAL